MKLSSSILLQRDFGLAWAGGLVSMLGSWALGIALPIHVYKLTGSPLATSGVVAAYVAPGVLLGSIAGVYVDRWNRRSTLVYGNLLLAVGTLPLVVVTGESRIWLVYPILVALSCVEQFTGPAENAFLPRLVRDDELVAANSLNALNNSLARLGGPAIGGALYAATGISGAVLADAASFAVAAVLLAAVRASGAVEAAGDATAAAMRRWRRVWHEWVDGLRLVRRERAITVVFAVRAITAVGEGVFGVMFVVWVYDVLEGGAPELGWLQTSQATGGILGGLAGAWVARRFAPERLFGLGLLAFGVFDLALFDYPLLFDGFWIGIGLMICVGAPGVWATAAQTTILQTHVEDAYRGRVFGSLGTSAALLMLAATTAAGVTGDLLGPIALLNFQGGAYVVSGLLVLLALGPRGYRLGAPADEPA
jgi:MFS family permease